MLVAVLLGATAVLLDYSGQPPGGKIVVTVRVWAEPIAAAYRQSFEAFNRAHPDIEVHTNVVAYSTYFNTLRTDVAGGSADDIFWLSNAYLAAYADSGRLMDIGKTLEPGAASAWDPAVVDQFTRGGALWGVPQLTDGGIARVLQRGPARRGRRRPRPAEQRCAGAPTAATRCAPCWPGSPLTPTDSRGHTAGFDGGRVRQWGYNAANDPQAIYLNYIGSAGGVFPARRRVRVRQSRGDRKPSAIWSA